MVDTRASLPGPPRERRDTLADAAIATIARDGLRGLTHRAVDRAAGVPEGSTSYYFRTREALLGAAIDRMAALDIADASGMPDLGAAADLDTLAAMLTAMVRAWLTGEGRLRTLARFELTLEAARRPDLHARMAQYSAGFAVMAETLLAAMGASEPRRRGRLLIAGIDGLVYHQVVGLGGGRLDDADLPAACRDLLETALR